MKNVLSILLLALAASMAAPGLAQDKPLANMEILRQKVKADKKLVVAHAMQLNNAEAAGFWPVYEAYQKELTAINDRTMKLIASYAEVYNKGTVPDATARKLLGEMLAIEDAATKLRLAYVPRLEKVLPAIKVARYLQVENKIRAAINYELAAAIPLVD